MKAGKGAAQYLSKREAQMPISWASLRGQQAGGGATSTKPCSIDSCSRCACLTQLADQQADLQRLTTGLTGD